MSAFGQPFASLSSGLLARKGGARPAMRRQLLGNGFDGQDDLGWNDMGYEDSTHHVHPHAGLTPMPGQDPEPHSVLPVTEEELFEAEEALEAEEAFVETPVEAEVPPVIEERVALARAVARRSKAATPRAPRAVRAAVNSKAAFTLRLDAERHLKLRLACAVTNRSAQQIVTEALDNLLTALPEVAKLADQVPQHAGKRRVG